MIKLLLLILILFLLNSCSIFYDCSIKPINKKDDITYFYLFVEDSLNKNYTYEIRSEKLSVGSWGNKKYLVNTDIDLVFEDINTMFKRIMDKYLGHIKIKATKENNLKRYYKRIVIAFKVKRKNVEENINMYVNTNKLRENRSVWSNSITNSKGALIKGMGEICTHHKIDLNIYYEDFVSIVDYMRALTSDVPQGVSRMKGIN